MNNKHILDLTLRLSQALDQNYDVVNMDIVLSVISALEGTTITKEQLEATRLGKYINQLRRRTKNDHLARRTKSLLKKWREMVGIQQQQQQQLTNEPIGGVVVAITNDNAMSATNIHSQTNLHNQLQQRSQPTSPMTLLHLDTHHTQSNSKQHYSQIACFTDGLPAVCRSAAAAVSPLTRSANLNVHNSNKRLDFTEGQSGASEHLPSAAVPSSSVPPSTFIADSGKQQPTSFANLIHSFRNDCNTADSPSGSGGSKSHKTALFNIVRTLNKPTETFIIDQSSNSNSAVSYAPSSRSASVAPIVIDIQDSNSGCNLISINATNSTSVTALTAPTAASKTLGTTAFPTTTTEPTRLSLVAGSTANMNTYTTTGFKPKRPKKDKKRKERESQTDSNVTTPQSLMVVLDESSSNQQRQPPTTTMDTEEKSTTLMDDGKCSLTYAKSNISEILSLSNSSISSMFPLESASRDDHPKLSLSANNNHDTATNISTADLSFAGKFKSQQGNGLPLVTTNINSYDLSRYNDTSLQRSTASPHVAAKSASCGSFAPQTQLAKFVPLSDGGCNSNNSTSNSRVSQSDATDVVSYASTKLSDPNVEIKQQTEISVQLYAQQKVTENLQTSQTTTPMEAQTAGVTQVTTQPSMAAVTALPEKAPPRKRGRKKGSKGVDSVIAKELSLTSQMLITSLGSGGKKVKTTKELYAEMQNRKLGIATTSSSPTLTNWPSQQQFISRPASSCSEPSLQSPRTLDACSTNATISTVATCSTPDKFLSNVHADDGDSDSGTLTSEQSRDSTVIQNHVKRAISVDSNSNSQMPTVSKSNDKKNVAGAVSNSSTADLANSKVYNNIAVIEKQLHELLKKLPPVPTLAQIEQECTVDIVPCTCSIIEIMPEDSFIKDQCADGDDQLPKVEADEAATSITVVKKKSIDKSLVPVADDVQKQVGQSVTDTLATSILMTLPIAKVKMPVPAPVSQKPKKSIFDLDFDDDEDPLHTIKAEAAAASIKQDFDVNSAALEESEVNMVDNATKAKQRSNKLEQQEQQEQLSLRFEQQQAALQLVLPGDGNMPESQAPPAPVFPTYQVEEDPNCVAKQRFTTQPQKITKFHIGALHNCFIPNVNGNWDNANDMTVTSKSYLDKATAVLGTSINSEIDGSNVVPKYGSLVTERIQKDLSCVRFTKNFKPKNPSISMEKLASIPFLGIARPIQKLYNKRNGHNHTNCYKVKSKSGRSTSKFQQKCEIKKTVEQDSDINTEVNDKAVAADLQTEAEVGANALVMTSTTDTASVEDVEFNSERCGYGFDDIKSTADSAIGTNNNVLLLKDITIDVSDDTLPLLQNTDQLTDNQNCRNLLAIVNNLSNCNYLLTTTDMIPKPDTGVSEISSNAIHNDATVTPNERTPHDDPDAAADNNVKLGKIHSDGHHSWPVELSNMSCVNAGTVTQKSTESSKVDENACSRRSSSCSSSSLKQTQQSINLKLKRQFQEQKLRETNGGRKRRRKKFVHRHCYAESDEGGGEDADNDRDDIGTVCKKRLKRIKRIKIAINGDIATQMQFSMGSSNNSSDEYNDGAADVNEDEAYEQATDTNNEDNDELDVEPDDDVESCNSAASHQSARYNYKTVNIDDVQNYDIDEPEVDYDEYDDFEDDYSGDYHEVVTRDLSTPSTGNNHIVLTIKKTPSKTNSPSNSLTAMSPVISNSTIGSGSNNSVVIARSPRVAALVAQADANNALATDAVIIIDDDDDRMEDEVVSSGRDTPITPMAIAEPEVQIEVLDDVSATTGMGIIDKVSGGMMSPNNAFVDFGDAFGDMSLTMSLAPKPRRHRRKRRRRLVRQCCGDANDANARRKLHQQLFFTHELCVHTCIGKQRILNISSCSSSCGSDYEYYCSDDDNSHGSVSDAVVAFEPKKMSYEVEIGERFVNTDDIKLEQSIGNELIEGVVHSIRSRSTSTVSSTCSTYFSACISAPAYTSIQNPAGTPAIESNSPNQFRAGVTEYVAIERTRKFSINQVTYPDDTCDGVVAVEINSPTEGDHVGDGNIAADININVSSNVAEAISDAVLPLENNGLLHSFNNIYYTVEQTAAGATRSVNVTKKLHNAAQILVGDCEIDQKQQQQHSPLKKQQPLQIPNENCDDYNNLYNNNNNNVNLIKYASNRSSLDNHVSCSFSCKESGSCNSDDNEDRKPLKQQTNIADSSIDFENDIVKIEQLDNNENLRKHFIENVNDTLVTDQKQYVNETVAAIAPSILRVPHEEYRTGLRAVDEDVDDDDGNNCARIQQFKEWHQVLQLSSYNDELLTVLPYVVLE